MAEEELKTEVQSALQVPRSKKTRQIAGVKLPQLPRSKRNGQCRLYEALKVPGARKG